MAWRIFCAIGANLVAPARFEFLESGPVIHAPLMLSRIRCRRCSFSVIPLGLCAPSATRVGATKQLFLVAINSTPSTSKSEGHTVQDFGRTFMLQSLLSLRSAKHSRGAQVLRLNRAIVAM